MKIKRVRVKSEKTLGENIVIEQPCKTIEEMYL